MVHRRIARIAALCVLVGGAVCQAEPLDLQSIRRFPDIYSPFISITYDPTTDAFSATGMAARYYTPDVFAITSGTFQLSATIDDTGFASSGTLTIGGATTGGSGSGSFEALLTGDLLDFGFTPDAAVGDPPGYPRFEFLLNPTGGSLAPDFAAAGPFVGVFVNGFSTFSGSFAEPYSNSLANSDTFAAVPEPVSACFMLTSALIVAFGWRRRRAGMRRRTDGEAG